MWILIVSNYKGELVHSARFETQELCVQAMQYIAEAQFWMGCWYGI